MCKAILKMELIILEACIGTYNAGHYLSASAQMWASTHNETLKEKMDAVVSALCDCQDIIGTGYLSAFPSEFFERVEALKPVWAPYYTIHKVNALVIFLTLVDLVQLVISLISFVQLTDNGRAFGSVFIC